MSKRDPTTTSAGTDATLVQVLPRSPSDSGLDETQLAPDAAPISALDATEIAVDGALAATQASGELAHGSAVPGPRAQASNAIASGTMIGRFLVTGELGAGGMGVVYAAYDPKLDRKVAIKMLHESIGSSHRKRLEREARAMAKLAHPNVVSVHEIGEFQGRLFVAMEFVDGKTLRDWLTQDDPAPKEIMRVMLDAGRGLAAAHAADMAHRDFKPDNVLVGVDGRSRVSDFGLVTPVGSTTIGESAAGPSPNAPDPDMALTQLGSVMGTPLYMAPEQHRGESADHRADQFSFCVTFWEALHGATPFGAKSYEGLVQNISTGQVSPPTNATRSSKWLRKILTRGLSVKPEERFESMNALLTALEVDPWRGRKRLAIGGSLAAFAGAAALLFAGGNDDPSAVCQGASGQLANVWTADIADQIAKAFGMSEVANAAEIWGEARIALDRYGQDWVRLRTQTCEATHVHKELDEELLKYSMQCFDHLLGRYRNVIEDFSSAPNTHLIAGAKVTVSKLADLASCHEVRFANDGTVIPFGGVHGPEYESLVSDLEIMRSHERRGEYSEALALSAPLIDRAVEASETTVEAEALTLKGAIQKNLGDYEEAQKTLRLAASAAARANDDHGVALVWIHVLELLVQTGDLDEALNIETVATTSAERVPTELALQAKLHNTLGGVYHAKARYKEALTAYEKALGYIQATEDPAHPALPAATSNIGIARWNLGDIEGAKESFEAGLVMMLRDFGPDHSQVAYARKNLGDLAIQLHDYDGARAHFEEVERIWKSKLGPEHANLAYVYESLARIAADLGDQPAALLNAEKTIKIREKTLGQKHPLVAQSLTVAIDIYIKSGTPEGLALAEETIVRALELIEALGETGLTSKVSVLESRATISETRELWKDALADRQEALAIRQSILGPLHNHTAYSHTRVAKLAMQLGDNNRAAEQFLEAQKIYDASPGFGDADGVNMRVSRAIVATTQGKNRRAMELLQEALEKARSGKDIGQMVSLVEFEIIKLRHTMGQRAEARAEARSLLETLAEGEDATRSSVSTWLSETK